MIIFDGLIGLCIFIKGVILMNRISETSDFSWPENHPIFLASTFVALVGTGVGASDGALVGDTVTCWSVVGAGVGEFDGISDGDGVGAAVGDADGALLSNVGYNVLPFNIFSI